MPDTNSNLEKLPLRDRGIPEISETLQEVLGQRLVAYAINETDPSNLDGYAKAEKIPTDEVEATLRDLAEVTEVGLKIEHGSTDMLRAGMIGKHPNLDDKSIIAMFHNGSGNYAAEVATSLFD